MTKINYLSSSDFKAVHYFKKHFFNIQKYGIEFIVELKSKNYESKYYKFLYDRNRLAIPLEIQKYIYFKQYEKMFSENA